MDHGQAQNLEGITPQSSPAGERSETVPGINLSPVTSSQIAAVGYDTGSKTLAIQFNNGKKVYHYAEVEQDEFEQLLHAESIGRHFGKHIRGKYTHTLVELSGGQE